MRKHSKKLLLFEVNNQIKQLSVILHLEQFVNLGGIFFCCKADKFYRIAFWGISWPVHSVHINISKPILHHVSSKKLAVFPLLQHTEEQWVVESHPYKSGIFRISRFIFLLLLLSKIVKLVDEMLKYKLKVFLQRLPERTDRSFYSIHC